MSGAAEPETRREIVVAIVLFLIAMVAFLAHQPAGTAIAVRVASLLLFTVLADAYLALGAGALREWLRAALGARWSRIIAGPAVLWAACVAYAAVAGLSVGDRAFVFGIYLAIPTLLIAWVDASGVGSWVPWRELTAAAILGLAIKYHLLPSLPLPAPNGYDASRLVGLVAGLYLFLVASPTSGIGYTWSIRTSDWGRALGAFALFAVVAVPIGLATRFLTWHPRLGASAVVLQPIVIYLVTAVPEEFLFRGLIQNLLMRWLGGMGFVIAAVIFGLSHLPDPRYALLATLAGAAYGWVYLRTGKITAAAVTHALVDAVWVALLRAS